MKNKTNQNTVAATSAGTGYSLRELAEMEASGTNAMGPGPEGELTSEQARKMLYELQVHQIELGLQNAELLRAQAELDATRSRYLNLYDLAPVGYVTLSEAGLIVEANLTAATLLSVARGSLLEQPFASFILPEDQGLYHEQQKRLLETGVEELCALRMLRSDETEFWVQLAATLAHDAVGAPVYRLVMNDDSERKRAEKEAQEHETQMLQVQKMAAVGQLAGGIAHDFNNILAAMIMQLGWLRFHPVVDPVVLARAVSVLWDSANRAASLVQQLLLFSRRQATEFSRVDANAIVVETTQLIDRLIGEDVILVVEPSREPLWILGDSGMIAQVAMNLCVNARDAMPNGGRLTVSTLPVLLGEEATERHTSVKPGPFLRLCVSDTGTGIDSDVLGRIFEPFFTTKERGKGTGLGLATVAGIIARHGGFVEVETQLGQGSSFSVYLPRVEHLTSLVKKTNDSKLLPGGAERILVVEDEAPVRRMVVHILTQLGYKVTEAANGAEALKIWHQEDGKFDLLFSDRAMPGGISGFELCSQLRQVRPGLPTIITSGYSGESFDDLAVENDVMYLCKPYEIALLASTIRSCLDKAVVQSEPDEEGSVPFSN